MARKTRVIAVMNRKGGVGKTTTAITLGVGLARKIADDGGHVLLVDLDPQGHTAKALGLRDLEGPTIAEVLVGRATPKDAAIKARGNLWVIPASDELADVKLDLLIAPLRQSRRGSAVEVAHILESTLESTLGVFEYVILDCAPSLDLLAPAVFNFADEVIVPVKLDYLGAEGTVQHTDNLLEARDSGAKARISWLVPTFYRGRELVAQQMRDSLNKTFPGFVAPPIPQAAAVEQATASGGLTIIEFDESSPAALAYNRLVELVHGR